MALPTIEKIAVRDVCRVLRETLCLDERAEINPDVPLKDIAGDDGARFEPMDLLEIFRKFKMNPQDYCSGERLTSKCKAMILHIAENAGQNDLYIKILTKDEIGIDECMEYLTPRMLAYAAIYGWTHQPAKGN